MWRRGSLREQQSCQRDVHFWSIADICLPRTYEVNGGHHIVIDEPDRLTEILLEVA